MDPGFRGSAIERPFQFVAAVQLVGSVERLPEHRKPRRAISPELSRHFQSALRFPLAKN